MYNFDVMVDIQFFIKLKNRIILFIFNQLLYFVKKVNEIFMQLDVGICPIYYMMTFMS